MLQETARILEHHPFQGDYRLLRLAAPGIGPQVRPGQFIELRVPGLADRILRRPFSVFRAGEKGITLLYKVVGRGTAAMSRLSPGEAVDLIGPLGNGFPAPSEGFVPVLVGGGYGSAALYLQAAASPVKGTVFLGGRTARDILCAEDFEALGWEVRIATEDGSRGVKGLVTEAFDPWLAERRQVADAPPVELFACGPTPMLRAFGERAIERGFTAWLSLDRRMGCGVGTCLACVIKRRLPDGGWEWARCCKEGPVFEAREIIWDDEEA